MVKWYPSCEAPGLVECGIFSVNHSYLVCALSSDPFVIWWKSHWTSSTCKLKHSLSWSYSNLQGIFTIWHHFPSSSHFWLAPRLLLLFIDVHGCYLHAFILYIVEGNFPFKNSKYCHSLFIPSWFASLNWLIFFYERRTKKKHIWVSLHLTFIEWISCARMLLLHFQVILKIIL